MTELSREEEREMIMRGPRNPLEKPAKKTPAKVCYDVFSLFRPWQACRRCQEALTLGEVQPPPEAGDLACPHVRRKEFVDLCNRIRAGGPQAPTQLRLEIWSSQATGERFAEVLWEEPAPQAQGAPSVAGAAKQKKVDPEL